MRGLFITGTDTSVGKTVVTCAIARQWRAQGRSFRVMKPVATGVADTSELAAAAGDPDLDGITPWRFDVPAAPPIAARLAGATLTLDEIIQAVQARAWLGDAVLIEGVGGLLCPLAGMATVADLITTLDVPVLVVARRSLGTLNHTLLTLEVARARKMRVRGIIVSETTPVSGPAEETNVAELRQRCDAPVLAVVPHGEPSAMDAVDWWSLVG